jgi:multidrug efflux system outer membrane protein
MKKYVLSTIALMLPLGGCTLWQDFQQPGTAAPQGWSTEAGTDAKPAWPDAQWWKEFNSPALNEQLEQASKENFDLKAATARVREADAQARINGAALVPAIGANASAGRTRSPGFNGSQGSSSSRTGNAFNGTLNASYEIDFWGKNYSAAQSARDLARASRFDQETVRLSTLSAVATNYFTILGTQERLAVARSNLSNAEQLMYTIQKRFTVGVATALDVAQQESVVATQRASLPPLEQTLRQAMDAQAILLGKLPEDVQQPQAKLTDIAVPEVGAGIPSELLERRPDVKNAEAQLASAHADIVTARAQFFPSISLTGEGGYESAALSGLFRPESVLWSAVASLAQPIFEGGLLQGQLDLRKARYDELLQDYRKSAISAFSDVEDALVAVKQTAAEEQAQELAAKTARRAYQLTQQQLKGGIVDITTVLNIQRTLFAAEDALVQARLSHLQAIVGLYKALGGGWKNGDAVPDQPPEPTMTEDWLGF